MVKSFNINLVIILTALMTTIGTAPVWEDNAIMKVTRQTRQSARNCASHRRRDVDRLPLDYINFCLDMSYMSTQIAEAASKSVPLFFPFKEQQLFQQSNESMRPSQLQFARAYHSLVFEKLKTLFYKIQHSTERFSETLKLQNRTIEPQISEILKNVLDSGATNLLRDELAPADSMQLPPEDQSYAYNYEPISDHGFGYGLEASTSQPRPQPVLIDFLGVNDMTREATPELVPRLWHSHDDRDPYTDHRFGNEEHRPPSCHVGFVGGSSMHPGPSTDNIWRPCDSSLHGHQSTSNIGVADSPPPYTRFMMFGEYLDPT
ncbi:hypothetical protein SeLEV6574_g08383 [Synchytrium endobioticum]|uniref:Uncharacterized protein n=1 Tax=Synchytrium endobioticum TaxID=286115 RepID=A0A507BX94_9FUNG|nr:hypothetical protein SeLEV6574_g08383 [Synchytrium endobioticum]